MTNQQDPNTPDDSEKRKQDEIQKISENNDPTPPASDRITVIIQNLYLFHPAVPPPAPVPVKKEKNKKKLEDRTWYKVSQRIGANWFWIAAVILQLIRSLNVHIPQWMMQILTSGK
jgi:hypothetical protein